jgi:hypothetical protein
MVVLLAEVQRYDRKLRLARDAYAFLIGLALV